MRIRTTLGFSLQLLQVQMRVASKAHQVGLHRPTRCISSRDDVSILSASSPAFTPFLLHPCVSAFSAVSHTQQRACQHLVPLLEHNR